MSETAGYSGSQHPYSLPPPADTGQSGHRGRLLERYVKTGIASLNDYEILELLLTFTIPRRDTKKLAKKLLADYGAVSAVINAPLDELFSRKDLTKRSAALFSLVKDAATFCLSERCEEKPIVTHRGDIEKYLRFNFGHRRDEYIVVIFLDSGSRVIGTEVVGEGTVNRCVVYPRKIIGAAIKCGASSFILAHNHPSGTAEPSEEDWKTTERLAAAGKCMDVPLVDHIIICKDKTVNLREHGRWQS